MASTLAELLSDRIRIIENELDIFRLMLRRKFPGDFGPEIPDSHMIAAPDLKPTDFKRARTDANQNSNDNGTRSGPTGPTERR